MSNSQVILSIDQGTTSSRTLVFTIDGTLLHTAQASFPQIYPQDGWVEHDPEAIWETVTDTLSDAFEFCQNNNLEIKAAGITNQRETTLIWNRKTGAPIYNAIVWQDRRTADHCARLKDAGHEPVIKTKTGLLLDPYFSASKAAWILDNVEGARTKANNGELLFGTIDSFLIWRLTAGRTHATDATNASRTSLLNIKTSQWDPELLEIFNVPPSLLPSVKDCADDYGTISEDIIPGNIAIFGVAGDQQAALIGQGCFNAGELKSTYGTGCFIVTNTGQDMILSKNNLLTTIGYRLNGKTTYALEGSIFVAGAAIQWLRDGLKLFDSNGEITPLVEKETDNPDLYFVPALTGLGAPHWNPNARGAIFGLTRGASRADIIRAALEGVAFQTHDLLDAMDKDGITPTALRVDGGMSANNWFLQALANITDITVERPPMLETTALGAARLAIMYLQAINSDKTDNLKMLEKLERFSPEWESPYRLKRLEKWEKAVKATQTFSQ